MTSFETIFAKDPERGAAYLGECAKISMAWGGVFGQNTEQIAQEVRERARLAARLGLRALRIRDHRQSGEGVT